MAVLLLNMLRLSLSCAERKKNTNPKTHVWKTAFNNLCCQNSPLTNCKHMGIFIKSRAWAQKVTDLLLWFSIYE